MLSNTHTQLKQIELMIGLQPIIHLIAVILRILQWKGYEKKYSLVCFLSLILFQLIQPYMVLLYCLPCAVLICMIYYQPSDISRRQKLQHVDDTTLVYDLTEIHNSIYFPTAVRDWVQDSDALCNAYQFYSMSSKRMRSFICIGGACLFTVAHAGWVILLQQQFHSSSLICFALLIIMCLHSPWVHLIQIASVRSMRPLLYSLARHGTDSDIAVSSKNEQHENQRGYRFEVYHHQRWWFPTGWSNLLLPQDRAVWTDAHLEATPSINNFCLPPKTTLNLENNQQKIVVWTWMDPKWSKHQDTTTTDSKGWQYGSWQWKQWSSQSVGLGVCTRRQKWYRHAQRTEYSVDIPLECPQQEQEDYCKTSCWDSQSNSSSNSSSSSSSSSPSGISTPVDSIIVPVDSKGVTFHTFEACTDSSSADAMYNKYCKSPVPQKFKRFSM